MLPSVKKTLSSAMTKLERVKKVIVGVAAVTALASGLMAVPAEAQAATSIQVSAGSPVLLMATPMGESVGRHYSHSSHDSHSSHSSHASHYSSRD